MSKTKLLIEQRNDLRAKADKILATAKAEGRAFTAEEKETFEDCINQIANIDTTLDASDVLAKITDREPSEPVSLTQEEKDIKNFANHIRAKIQGTNVVALSAGANGDIIPTSIAKKIIKKVNEISPIYSRATKYEVRGDVTVPRVDATEDDITVAYADEFATVEAHSNKFASITLKSHMYSAIAKISKQLINNSDFDLVNFVINYMAEKIALFLDHECLVGTEGKSKGVIGSYDSENMKITLASAAAPTADELIDIQEMVPDTYRPNCEWVMHKSTRKAIRKLKSPDGEYLLQRDFTASSGWTLLGNPVRISDNMPEIGTAASEVIIFGDYSGLAVKEAVPFEIEVLKELYSSQNAVGVKCYGEIDAQVENTQKFACGVTP